MSRVRYYAALLAAKSAYLAIKILNKSSGTSFVGKLALKICPDFLKYCKKYMKKGITIAVTGTNGKTTTSGLLAQILETDKNRVLHNVKGANMLTGIANVFALNISPFSKGFDYAVLESDEAYLTKLYDYYKSDFLLVTNLFRDQLDRYGELETTAGFIRNAIEKNEKLILLLNADDPLVTNLGKNKEAFFYGFESVEICSDVHKGSSNAPTEVFNCICSESLQYSKRFFAQEGHYYCTKCGYTRPEPNFKGYVRVFTDYSELTVEHEGNCYDFKLNLVGLYNAYNALSAISMALLAGIDYKVIRQAVSEYKSIFGRAEKRLINGHDTLIQLIKNPTGASEVLKTVDLESNIVIAINDNYADGRDISWLWDSDFEQLKNAKHPIITSGIRAKDMATRLKYAGIPTDKIVIEEDIKKAIEMATNSSENKDTKITILPSYTALLKINKMKF